MKKYLYPFLLFLLSSSISIAQPNSGFNFHTRIGLVGDHKDQEATYESFETSHSVQTNLAWAVGAAYQYFHKQHLGLKTGLMYEHNQFTRVEEYQYQNFRGVNHSGKISRQYTNHSLLVPLQLLWQKNKFGLSTGLITNIHLKTKAEEEHIFFEEKVETSRTQNAFHSGGFIGDEALDWTKTDLDKRISFQFVLGIYYQLSPMLSIDLEYKDFISKNLLIQEISNFDVGGTWTETYDPFAQSISVGLNWSLATSK